MSSEQPRQRFSKLAPFSLQDHIELAIAALTFFSPMAYEKNCDTIGRSPTPGRTEPLDGSEFLIYLDRTGKLNNPRRYRQRVAELLARLERAGLLLNLGQGNDLFLGKKYYFLKELTNLEKRGILWLSQALGPQFIRGQYASFTAQITGLTQDGDVHAGTGLILTANCILTCAHVLRDMKVHDKQTICENEFRVVATIPHPTIDIGLVHVEPALPVVPVFSFRDPELSEPLYTLGYPRVPLARNAPLVMQSGEVTSPEVKLLHGAEVFLYSAVARPGNSGGPIISSTGHVLGIVTEELSAETSKPSMPFHAGIRTSTIRHALTELEPSLALPIEDYE